MIRFILDAEPLENPMNQFPGARVMHQEVYLPDLLCELDSDACNRLPGLNLDNR
jgi:hypothetical protein